MFRRIWLSVLILACGGGLCVAAEPGPGTSPRSGPGTRPEPEPVFSGPQAGEKLPPLPVRDILAEPAEDLELTARADGKPFVVIFVHQRTRPAFALTNALLRFSLTRRSADLSSAAVFLTADPTDTGNWMKQVRNLFPKDGLITISPDGAEGPGAWGLNREVTLTVVVGNAGRATANFALVQPGLQADGPKIAKAILDVTGGGELPDLTKFLGSPDRPAMQRPAEDHPELTSRLRALINREATPDEVDRAAKSVEELLEKDPAARARIADITTRIIDADKLDNYGIPRAREHLRAWNSKYAQKPAPVKP